MKDQNAPPGYYISNSSDEDCFFLDKKGDFFFKKEEGKTWLRTDSWNFHHICNVETVDASQGGDVDIDTYDGKGIQVKVSAHVGVTVTDVLKWHYVNPDGNQAKVWAGVTGGPGEGVSADVGVWYDKHGDIHMKISTCGVIPHVAFGVSLVINPKTLDGLDKPTDADEAFAKGFTEGATFGIATKAPLVLTKAVATIHKAADDIDDLFK